jgi:hypothetical protein
LSDQAESIIAEMAAAVGRVDIDADGWHWEIARACWAVITGRCNAALAAAEEAGPAMPNGERARKVAEIARLAAAWRAARIEVITFPGFWPKLAEAESALSRAVAELEDREGTAKGADAITAPAGSRPRTPRPLPPRPAP